MLKEDIRDYEIPTSYLAGGVGEGGGRGVNIASCIAMLIMPCLLWELGPVLMSLNPVVQRYPANKSLSSPYKILLVIQSTSRINAPILSVGKRYPLFV